MLALRLPGGKRGREGERERGREGERERERERERESRDGGTGYLTVGRVSS